jgi:pimeloyl-ACP methyl ester carboxylesterase
LDDRKVAINCDETPTVLGTHQQAVDELKLWFDWLKDKGHDRFVLVGHSRGGAQSTLFWETHKYPGIEQLILIAPATFDYESTARNFEENFRVPLAEQIAYYKKLENKTDPITESALLYCFYAKTSAETFLSYYEETPQKHTPAMLADIEIPTTVFLGSEDRLSDRFMSYEMEFSNNDKVSTYWVEGADHFFRDLYADEIIEEVLYGDDS